MIPPAATPPFLIMRPAIFLSCDSFSEQTEMGTYGEESKRCDDSAVVGRGQSVVDAARVASCAGLTTGWTADAGGLGRHCVRALECRECCEIIALMDDVEV